MIVFAWLTSGTFATLQTGDVLLAGLVNQMRGGSPR